MSDNREDGLVEIYNRIKDKRTEIGLTTFVRTPTKPITEKQCPCVFMLEGTDSIFKRSSRNTLGYPAHRSLEVTLELVASTKGTLDIKEIFPLLKRSVFQIRGTDPPQYNSVIAENLFFNENRTEGPISYGLPDIKVMRFVIDLIYIDGGF